MKDYHQTGMYNDIESLLLIYRPINNVIYIKLSGTETSQTLSFIEKKWKEIFPDQPFTYTYLTERFNRQFEADEKRGSDLYNFYYSGNSHCLSGIIWSGFIYG